LVGLFPSLLSLFPVYKIGFGLKLVKLFAVRETCFLRRELGPAGIVTAMVVSSDFRSAQVFVGSFVTSKDSVSPEGFNS